MKLDKKDVILAEMISHEYEKKLVELHEQQLRAIDKLPKLSSEEELQLIKICVNGNVVNINEFEVRKFYQGVYIPELIEVTGMPDIRKTTLARKVRDKLTQIGINIELIEEPHPTFNKLAVPYHYNMAMFHNTSERLIKHFTLGLDRPSLILDRGVWGQIAFLDAYRRKERIELDDYTYDISSRYIALNMGFFIDALIINKSSPELAHKPESEWLSLEFLSLLRQAYERLPDTIAAFQKEFHIKKTAPYNEFPPLVVAELNADDGWDIYSDRFIRSFGSIFRLFVKGNNLGG